MSNAKYNLHILAPAQYELEEIALVHLRLVASDSARKITNRIYDALTLLQINPHMGVSCGDRLLKIQDYRMLICGNYLCIYRLISNKVFVYHIVDGRADYPKLLNDL